MTVRERFISIMQDTVLFSYLDKNQQTMICDRFFSIVICFFFGNQLRNIFIHFIHGRILLLLLLKLFDNHQFGTIFRKKLSHVSVSR